mmetsp:Transcript_77135/g.213187  ORF Transcript_77135/g.213187 Transcript_77135/m.213187 type:complete len:355 (-) Transcript_77135:136-1200(-)
MEPMDVSIVASSFVDVLSRLGTPGNPTPLILRCQRQRWQRVQCQPSLHPERRPAYLQGRPHFSGWPMLPMDGHSKEFWGGAGMPPPSWSPANGLSAMTLAGGSRPDGSRPGGPRPGGARPGSSRPGSSKPGSSKPGGPTATHSCRRMGSESSVTSGVKPLAPCAADTEGATSSVCSNSAVGLSSGSCAGFRRHWHAWHFGQLAPSRQPVLRLTYLHGSPQLCGWPMVPMDSGWGWAAIAVSATSDFVATSTPSGGSASCLSPSTAGTACRNCLAATLRRCQKQRWHCGQFAPSRQPPCCLTYRQAAAQVVGWPTEPREGGVPSVALPVTAGRGTSSASGGHGRGECRIDTVPSV